MEDLVRIFRILFEFDTKDWFKINLITRIKRKKGNARLLDKFYLNLKFNIQEKFQNVSIKSWKFRGKMENDIGYYKLKIRKYK